MSVYNCVTGFVCQLHLNKYNLGFRWVEGRGGGGVGPSISQILYSEFLSLVCVLVSFAKNIAQFIQTFCYFSLFTALWMSPFSQILSSPLLGPIPNLSLPPRPLPHPPIPEQAMLCVVSITAFPDDDSWKNSYFTGTLLEPHLVP